MAINQALLPEFENEMATTRRVLERVPDDKFDWKPHEKSMTMGHLASHIAHMAGWTVATLGQESLDLAPPGEPPIEMHDATSNSELLAMFDQNVAGAKSALESASDEQLMQTWSLLKGGDAIFTLPRVAVLRALIFNHIIHHRGQMSVYLRENDIPVPSIYGPSADENNF